MRGRATTHHSNRLARATPAHFTRGQLPCELCRSLEHGRCLQGVLLLVAVCRMRKAILCVAFWFAPSLSNFYVPSFSLHFFWLLLVVVRVAIIATNIRKAHQKGRHKTLYAIPILRPSFPSQTPLSFSPPASHTWLAALRMRPALFWASGQWPRDGRNKRLLDGLSFFVEVL